MVYGNVHFLSSIFGHVSVNKLKGQYEDNSKKCACVHARVSRVRSSDNLSYFVILSRRFLEVSMSINFNFIHDFFSFFYMYIILDTTSCNRISYTQVNVYSMMLREGCDTFFYYL